MSFLSMEQHLSRRQLLGQISSAWAIAALPSVLTASEPVQRTGLGLVIYDCNIRRRWLRQQNSSHDLFRPMTFLQHCHALGAGGMQASLGVLDNRDVQQLADYARQHRLFIDAIIKPPKSQADLSRFEAEIKTARDVGVQAARTTIIPGRRYERFKTLPEFREYEKRGREMLERAVPIVEKHRVRFAVENHKDQCLEERLRLLKHIDSEYVGACVDTGNSFALLDGVYEPIEALAPYAFSVHLKDQALRPFQNGFLLGDIPLGQGSFDLKRMVAILRKSKPKLNFSLELITRDPLEVPCLTEQYFATMSTVPARQLAQTLRFVSQHPAKHLQQVSQLSLEDQVQLEDANILASLRYAAKELKL